MGESRKSQGELEMKIEERNEQIAKLLKQKQSDQKEINEMKFKLERENNLNGHLQIENEQLKHKIEQMKQRFLDQQRTLDNMKY